MQEANLSLGEQAGGEFRLSEECPGMRRELRMVGLLLSIKMSNWNALQFFITIDLCPHEQLL